MVAILLTPHSPATDDVGNRNNSITALDKPQEMNSKANGDTLKPKPVAHLQDAERERLSSTPVGQVADTAAEVADTANKLDDDVPDRVGTTTCSAPRSRG